MSRAWLVLIVLGVACNDDAAKVRKFSEAKLTYTRVELKKLAYEGYAQWAATHESAVCPKDIDELKEYVNKPALTDPWNNKYIMKCGDGALPAGVKDTFGVVSMGPDGKEGTDDDLHSWDK